MIFASFITGYKTPSLLLNLLVPKSNCSDKKLSGNVIHEIKATVSSNSILFAAQGENNTINYKGAHNNVGSHNRAAKKSKAHFIKLIACL